MGEPLRLVGENFECRTYDQDHAFLYTFAGELACYDHVFLLHDETETEVEHGRYIWKDDPAYEDASEHLLCNDFPVCLNFREVSDTDLDIFNWEFGLEEAAKVNSVPEDWVQ